MIFHILLVDDEPHVLETMTELIEGQNRFEAMLYRAESGREALRIMGQERIDLIITDICMPDIDGLALLDYVYKLWPSCKVLFLTAFTNFDYAYFGIQKGISGYILKTEDYETILSAVEQAISDIHVLKVDDHILNDYQKCSSSQLNDVTENRTDTLHERDILRLQMGYEDKELRLIGIRTNISNESISTYIMLVRRYFDRLSIAYHYAYSNEGVIWILVQIKNDILLQEILADRWLNGVVDSILIAGIRTYHKTAHSIIITLNGIREDISKACDIMLTCLNRIPETEPYSVRTLSLARALDESKLPIYHNASKTTTQYMIKYIDEHVDRDITLLDLAAITGYNADYLSYIFSRQTGITFHSYISKKKLERISEYMSDSALSLDEICALMKFKTRSYFNRFVKRESGLTPKQLRSRILSAALSEGSIKKHT